MAMLKVSFRMRKRYVEEERRSFIFITKTDHFLNPCMMLVNVDNDDVHEVIKREKTYRLRADRMVFTEVMAQLGRNFNCYTSKDGEQLVIRPNLSEFFDRINSDNDIIAQIHLDMRSRTIKVDAGLPESLEVRYGREDYTMTYIGDETEEVPEFQINDFIEIVKRDVSRDVYNNYDD